MRGKTRRVLKTALWLVAAGMLAIALVNFAVFWSSRGAVVAWEDVEPAQVALVPGAYVYPNGTPSAVVQDRLDTALDLYRSGRVARILVSGDHGEKSYDEVNGMRKYLERNKVPTEHIFMDHAGFDTYDSMYRAREVFAVRSAVVVTQGFHLHRALYIARSLGLKVQGLAADRRDYMDASYYDLREILARVKAFGEVTLARKPVFLGPVIPITGDGRQTHG
ncbi:MAG: SanA/YdcF family protein [Candidatus Xenobium sp.]|nr:DUF218 domain-containing protein [Burkholderiales bacterium]